MSAHVLPSLKLEGLDRVPDPALVIEAEDTLTEGNILVHAGPADRPAPGPSPAEGTGLGRIDKVQGCRAGGAENLPVCAATATRDRIEQLEGCFEMAKHRTCQA